MEVKVEDNSLLVVGDDGEVYGIDDADALIDFVIETTVDNMLENISDKIDMELAEELVKALDDKEAADKANVAKAKTYRTRKRASKSQRKLIVKSDKEEEVEGADSPKDDVVLTTSRDTNKRRRLCCFKGLSLHLAMRPLQTHKVPILDLLT
ncbi:hypothetical protein Dimus_018459 [Dionaea muscipula]